MTIHELAKKLKVSAATVSLALNGNQRISEATRRKVLSYAEKTGYRINEQARNLRLGRSALVALVVYDIASGFWAGAVGAIEQELGEDYGVIVCNSGGVLAKERAIVANLVARRIDGLIIQPADSRRVEHCQALMESGVPAILLERSLVDGLSFVKGDDLRAGVEAARLFAKAGRERALFICHAQDRNNIGEEERLSGFKREMGDRGLGSFKIARLESFDNASLEAAIRPMLKSVDAIICVTQLPSLHRILLQAGARIPDDIATLCWDDLQIAEHLVPSMSGVCIPIAEIGKRAAEAIKNYHTGRRDLLKTLLEEPFVLRESFKT